MLFPYQKLNKQKWGSVVLLKMFNEKATFSQKSQVWPKADFSSEKSLDRKCLVTFVQSVWGSRQEKVPRLFRLCL